MKNDQTNPGISTGTYIFVFTTYFASLPLTAYLINSLAVREIINRSFLRVDSRISSDQKLILVGYGLGSISVLFIFLSVLVVFTRVSTSAPNPVTHGNSKLIQTFDRCLVNTLEQAWIFVPNYVIWIFVATKPLDTYLITFLPALWIMSRVLYSLGYAIGIPLGLSVLRVIGNAVGLSLSLLLCLRNIGWLELEKYFVMTKLGS